MATEHETSREYFRRMKRRQIEHVNTLPMPVSWADEPIVVNLGLDLDGLCFVAAALIAHAPADGATGELEAVRDRICELLEATRG